MFCVTVLSVTVLGLVACQEEQSSLLQTAGRDNALTTRARNVVDAEDENSLDDALGGKQCTAWLADQAVAKANAELETFRVEMKELGYEQKIKDHVKIGAYCPSVLVDSALTFLGTPCEDRDHALEECIKGLTETCKYEKKAIERMMETVKKVIKKDWQTAKRAINHFPQEFRPELPNINFDSLFKSIKDTIKQMDCDQYKKLKVPELSSELFTNMNDGFKNLLAMLRGLQTEQGAQFAPLVQQGQDAVNVATAQAGAAVNVGSALVANILDNNPDIQDALTQAAQEMAKGLDSPQQLQNDVNQLQATFQGLPINTDSALGQDIQQQVDQVLHDAEVFNIGGNNGFR